MVKHLKVFFRKGTAVVAVAGLLLITQPQPAHAGGFDPIADLYIPMQYVELCLQYAQQVQQYMTQIQQFENELKQAEMLPNQFMNMTHSQMVGLAQVVQRGQALAYSMSNFDDAFNTKFSGIGYTPTQNFSQRYQQWSQTTHDSVQGALDAANLQASDMNDEEDIIDDLQSQAQTADGQMEAVQVGNQIAAAEADQLIKLRQLMQSDMQAKYSFQMQQQQQQDEQQKALGMFQNSTVFVGGDGVGSFSGGSSGSNVGSSGDDDDQ